MEGFIPYAEEDLIEDIEDIVGEGDLVGLERSVARSNAVIKRVKKCVKRKQKTVNGTNHEDESHAEYKANTIPGTQKIWVKTWGCAHNNSDSEYMAGQLAAYGYSITGKSIFYYLINLIFC